MVIFQGVDNDVVNLDVAKSMEQRNRFGQMLYLGLVATISRQMKIISAHDSTLEEEKNYRVMVVSTPCCVAGSETQPFS